MPVARVWEFFETYTRDLRADDLQRVFTRETPEAWQMFARAIKAEEIAQPALAHPGGRIHAARVPGVHDAAVTGAPRDLRHRGS